MTRITLILLASLAAVTTATAQVPIPPPPSAGGGSPGRLMPPETGPGSARYETDGNAKNPAATESPNVPAYQQGSGQETGGPARELIPR